LERILYKNVHKCPDIFIFCCFWNGHDGYSEVATVGCLSGSEGILLPPDSAGNKEAGGAMTVVIEWMFFVVGNPGRSVG